MTAVPAILLGVGGVPPPRDPRQRARFELKKRGEVTSPTCEPSEQGKPRGEDARPTP